MIDWNKYSSLPTPSTLNSYPTILEILEDIVGMQNSQIKRNPLDRGNRDFFYDWSSVGHYMLCRDAETNMPQLMPTSRSMFTFYRGQSKYYEKCLPSLYRHPALFLMDKELCSNLQVAESILVMQTHPVIRDLSQNFLIVPNVGPVRLPIEYYGLAQHYGIETNLLDLTNDIWTAAFFASTIYSDGRYFAVEINDNTDFSERYGVLYRLDYSHDKTNEMERSHIKPIGLQYFNRPGRQCGFVRSLKDVRDFHKVPNLERIYFRHDNDASILIFTLSQWSKQYMPNDSFADVIKSILDSRKISKTAVNLAYKNCYIDTPYEEYLTRVKYSGLEITDELSAAFDQKYLEKENIDWFENGGRNRFLDKILVFPIAMMSCK